MRLHRVTVRLTPNSTSMSSGRKLSRLASADIRRLPKPIAFRRLSERRAALRWSKATPAAARQPWWSGGRRCSQKLHTSEGSQPPWLPVVVRFRDLSEPAPASLSELPTWLFERAYQAPTDCHSSGLLCPREVRPIWFLDGWDEAAPAYHTERTVADMAALPGIKVLTCRSARVSALEGVTQLARHVAPSRRFSIHGLNDVEQQSLVEHQFEDPSAARKLLELVRSHAQLRRLTSSPLLLSMLAESWHREERHGRPTPLPATRDQFYRRAVDDMWTTNLQGTFVGDEDALVRDEVLTALAGTVRLAPAFESASLIRALEDSGLESRRERGEVTEQLISAGLLRRGQLRTLEYVHLSFQEHFLARHLSATEDFARHSRRVLGGSAVRRDARVVRSVERGALRRTLRSPEISVASSSGGVSVGSPMMDRWSPNGARTGSWLEVLGRSGLDSSSAPHSLHVVARHALEATELVQLAIARNPVAPSAVLERLAFGASNSVRRSLCYNDKTPARARLRLAREGITWGNAGTCVGDLLNLFGDSTVEGQVIDKRSHAG